MSWQVDDGRFSCHYGLFYVHLKIYGLKGSLSGVKMFFFFFKMLKQRIWKHLKFFFCFSFTLLLASQRCMVKCLSWDLQGFSIPCMSHIVKNELVWGLIVSAPTGLISYRKLKVTLNLISNNQLPNPLQVGCGAIGCEMLKNYALLGVSRASGKVYSYVKIFANFKLEEK